MHAAPHPTAKRIQHQLNEAALFFGSEPNDVGFLEHPIGRFARGVGVMPPSAAGKSHELETLRKWIQDAKGPA